MSNEVRLSDGAIAIMGRDSSIASEPSCVDPAAQGEEIFHEHFYLFFSLAD
jgi:hypothetical protein